MLLYSARRDQDRLTVRLPGQVLCGHRVAARGGTPRGLLYDREWMVVTPTGAFLRSARRRDSRWSRPHCTTTTLQLAAPGLPTLTVPLERDRCGRVRRGDGLARSPARNRRRRRRGQLVRRAPRSRRAIGTLRRVARDRRIQPGHRASTGASAFADGYPVLVVSRASLDDLNARLPAPIPIDRFRPNVVLDWLRALRRRHDPRAECGQMRLRLVKPCTRCVITTIDQATGVAAGRRARAHVETYRWDGTLRGVTFGQNAIVERAGPARSGRAAHE